MIFLFKKISILCFILFGFSLTAHADDRDIKIYVASAEVVMNEVRGTSKQLNMLVDSWADATSGLRSGLSKWTAPGFIGTIKVYTSHNISFLYPNCNYARHPLTCGVKNNHWTVLTHVHVGDKFSTINSRMYNERGEQVASSQVTAWGEVKKIPQWKYTKTKETGGMMGPIETEVFEQWPAKIEELPPLIKPDHVHRAISLMYSSYKPPGR